MPSDVYLIRRTASDGKPEFVGGTFGSGEVVGFAIPTREQAESIRVGWALENNIAPDDLKVLRYIDANDWLHARDVR